MIATTHPFALEPMIQPDTISGWPMAWGWWLVIILSLVLLILVSVATGRYWRRRAPIRQARQALRQCYQQPQSGHFIQQCNTLMKHVCLHFYPHAASLAGSAWLRFIQQHDTNNAITDEYGSIIAYGGYQAHCTYDRDELYRQTDHWLQQLPLPNKSNTPATEIA